MMDKAELPAEGTSTTTVQVDNAENVNTSAPADLLAHPAVIWIVTFVTAGVLIGFGWVTFAILNSDAGVTPETKGAVIQTWNNLAVAAAAVWTSSSLIGRLKGGR